MITIAAATVNQALIQGLQVIANHGHASPSRNGAVLSPNGPVTTMTSFPTCRVLSVPGRGENPFFHLIESLWMLAGRNDLKPLVSIVPSFKNYSDDGGKTQRGAYGYRWRKWFEFDQLDWAIRRLKDDPNDRRVVITHWDGNKDPRVADVNAKDVPCNTHIYLLVRDGQLDMTVCCRSNDMLWGAHGANAVHFSMLQEYLAAGIGVGVGVMWQVSNNYHLYEGKASPALLEAVAGDPTGRRFDRYQTEIPVFETGAVWTPYPIFDQGQPFETWAEDLEMWWEEPTMVGLRHSFFRRVATPVMMAQKALQQKQDPSRFQTALDALAQCRAPDWREACEGWVKRAQTRYNKAQADGPDRSV